MKSAIIYFSIQAFAYAIDMGLFLVFLKLTILDAVWANVTSKLISAVFSFSAHRSLTFPSADRDAKISQALKYFLLLGINIPLATIMLTLLMKWIEQPALAKFIADVICVGISFAQTRYLVFPKRR